MKFLFNMQIFTAWMKNVSSKVVLGMDRRREVEWDDRAQQIYTHPLPPRPSSPHSSVFHYRLWGPDGSNCLPLASPHLIPFSLSLPLPLASLVYDTLRILSLCGFWHRLRNAKPSLHFTEQRMSASRNQRTRRRLGEHKQAFLSLLKTPFPLFFRAGSKNQTYSIVKLLLCYR